MYPKPGGTFGRVTERHGKTEIPIKHLYRREYQMTNGQWSTLYYARFRDWKCGLRGSGLAS